MKRYVYLQIGGSVWLLILLVFLLVSLSGCFNGAGNMVIPNEMVEGATETVSNITDASVMKEAIVHKTLQNQDKMINASNQKPSFEMGWQTVEETVYYPGMAAPLAVKKSMPTIKYTEKQAFTQVRPTAPSEHPGWKYGSDAVKTIAQYSFYGWLSNGLFNMVEKGWNMVGLKHNGDNYQSNNAGDGIGPVTSTAPPYVFGAEAIPPSVPLVQ
jgi:hypothetical protein